MIGKENENTGMLPAAGDKKWKIKKHSKIGTGTTWLSWGFLQFLSLV